MIPYAVYEYHGPLTYFDASGAGIGDWIKVYLCNGANNTPDKRGFVSVGVTTGMLGGSLNPLVDPALPGNPPYTIGAVTGTNSVGLTINQIPSHTHTGVTNTTGAHSHVFAGYTASGSNDGSGGEDAGYFENKSTAAAGDHSHTLSINAIGGGQAHPNTQPGIGCYYIQYRP
jgi:microcystin-dependent protein